MATRKIAVEIDCDEDRCGPCHCLGAVTLEIGGRMNNPICNVFDEDLGKAPGASGDDMPNAYRCEKCKASEAI